jgi:hypothetical protein
MSDMSQANPMSGPAEPRFALVLHPADPDAAPRNGATLYTVLEAIGLAGAAFGCAGGARYLPGPRYLELVTFLGCSPFVQLEPPEGVQNPCEALDRFCHLSASEASEQPYLRRARAAPTPRCPNCRGPVEDWASLVADGLPHCAKAAWTCPGCGRTSPVYALDWRQSAGLARVFVSLWGIHPGEAVPGDELLSALADTTGGPWRWFYEQA